MTEDHRKPVRLALAALQAAIHREWPTVQRTLERLNAECDAHGLALALVAWCDAFAEHANDGVSRMANDFPRVSNVRPADENNQVVTVVGGEGQYRRQPCGPCPWRVDQTGSFPAEAFGHSAPTAYDMATHMFGCHESGTERPVTCAGFLLRGADNNMAWRLRVARVQIDMGQVSDGGHELHDSYRAMAVANGLDPDDWRLRECRP